MIDGFLGEFADKMLAFSELEDEDALRELQAGFNRQTKNTVVGCVGDSPLSTIVH